MPIVFNENQIPENAFARRRVGQCWQYAKTEAQYLNQQTSGAWEAQGPVQ